MSRVELVSEWFEIASTDLNTAKHLFETMRPRPLEIICYHCQQAAEKALKGFLIDQEAEPPRIHDLGKLCALCAEYDPDFTLLLDACQELTDYATAARYPSRVEIEEQDAVSALDHAEKIYTFSFDLIPALRPEQGPTLSQ